MPNNYPEIKKFLGLFAQQNSFDMPDGAMEQALNVVINDDNVISKVRGFYRYFSPVSGVIRALTQFQDKLVAVYNNKMSYFNDIGVSPNETGSEVVLSGATVTVGSTRQVQFAEAGGNLYATTDLGVVKLDDINGPIFAAGVPAGLDIRGSFLPANGPIAGDKQIGYRVVFGRKDAHGTLLLGAPSDFLTLSNSKTLSLAYTSAVSVPNYVVTVTAPLHNLTVGMTITVSDATNANANGVATVSAVTSINAFQFIKSSDPVNGTLSYITSRKAIVEFSIPREFLTVSEGWFFQLYRSSLSGGADATPPADFKLVDELKLTVGNLLARFVQYEDGVDDLLVQYASELYTNPNSREGELQANHRPPLAEDIALFNNYVFYANTKTRDFLSLDVETTVSLNNSSYIEITDGLAATYRFQAQTGVGNKTVKSDRITPAVADIIIEYANHGFYGGYYIYVSAISGGSLAAGYYYVAYDNATYTSAGAGPYTITVTKTAHGLTTGVFLNFNQGTVPTVNGVYSITVLDPNTFTYTAPNGPSPGSGSLRYVKSDSFKISLTSGGAAVAYSAVDYLFFQGVTNGTYYIFQLNNTSGSVAIQLRDTALGIVKAINRNPGPSYTANYASSITDVPGKMRLSSLVFNNSISVTVPVPQWGEGFFPVVTASLTDVKSKGDTDQNGIFVSKLSEPEAVPFINKFLAGSKNQPVLRIVPLRNSLIILKKDGVFKLTGDNPNNFTVTLIDNTVRIIAKKSAAATANQVYFLSSEGICTATDSSVEIVSRRIENRLENIVGLSNIDSETAAVAYDTDRTYRICTVAPNESVRTISYFHNSINDTWTESDVLFTAGTVGPGNVLYLVSGGLIKKERKKQNRIDYCGQNYAVTIDSVASDLKSANITMSTAPAAGDLIEKNNAFSRIKDVSGVGPAWVVTFLNVTTLEAGDTETLYKGYTSKVIMAPFHAGSVGRAKHFSQLQIHTRTPSVSRVVVEFSGQSFGGDKDTVWESSSVTGVGGWGAVPWGFFNWGLEDGIRNIYNTVPAPIIRLYVPLFQARSTFLKAIITHREAGEAIEAQALAWVVRGYNERVTK